MELVPLRIPRPRQSADSAPWVRRARSGTHTIVPQGAILGRAFDALVEALEGQLAVPPARVVIDLHDVSHLPRPAQVVLLRYDRRLLQHGALLVLCAPSESVRRQGAELDLFGRIRTISGDVTDE